MLYNIAYYLVRLTRSHLHQFEGEKFYPIRVFHASVHDARGVGVLERDVILTSANWLTHNQL